MFVHVPPSQVLDVVSATFPLSHACYIYVPAFGYCKEIKTKMGTAVTLNFDVCIIMPDSHGKKVLPP